MSSTNTESMTSCFPNYIPLISHSYLIALARTSRHMSNRYGENGQSFVVLDFCGIAESFSPLQCVVGCCLAVYCLYYVQHIPCIPVLSKIFIIKRCCILSKAFLTSNEMIMQFLSFSFFIWCIILTDIHMLNHPCISGMKPT